MNILGNKGDYKVWTLLTQTICATSHATQKRFKKKKRILASSLKGVGADVVITIYLNEQ